MTQSWCHSELGDYKNARNVTLLACDAFAEASEPLDELAARFALASINVMLGAVDHGLAQLLSIRLEFERRGATPYLFDLLVELGETYRILGRLDDAEEAYVAAIALPRALNRDPHTVHFNLAMTHLQLGRFEQALPAFEDGLVFYREAARLLDWFVLELALAVTLCGLGRFEHARVHLTSATELLGRQPGADVDSGILVDEAAKLALPPGIASAFDMLRAEVHTRLASP